jgi:hypothetical protein
VIKKSRLAFEIFYLSGRAGFQDFSSIDQITYLQELKLVLLNLVRGQFDLAGYMVIITRNFPFVNVDKYGI